MRDSLGLLKGNRYDLFTNYLLNLLKKLNCQAKYTLVHSISALVHMYTIYGNILNTFLGNISFNIRRVKIIVLNTSSPQFQTPLGNFIFILCYNNTKKLMLLISLEIETKK